MEEKRVNKTLPEDLVGRILSMVPFPFIFKARVLSKSWLARFSSVATQEDEEKKCLAVSFQKEVGDWSTTWETFSPVLIDWDVPIGYDRASHSWQTMPSLSFVPESLSEGPKSDLQLEGPLLLWSDWMPTEDMEIGFHPYCVANILIRSWKRLPPRPHPGEGFFVAKKLVNLQGEKYKVIAIYQDFGYFVVQIYDSKLDAWSIKKHVVSKAYYELSALVYLNGVLYMIDRLLRDLVALNVEEETLEELEMPSMDIQEAASVNLVVCNANLMVIACEDFHDIERITVLKIDLVSRRLSEVTQGPPAALNVERFLTRSVSHGDFIFFVWEKNFLDCAVVQYNIRHDEWSNFRLPTSFYEWTDCSFEPGLNPFLAV